MSRSIGELDCAGDGRNALRLGLPRFRLIEFLRFSFCLAATVAASAPTATPSYSDARGRIALRSPRNIPHR